MTQAVATQTDLGALWQEFRAYVESLQRSWAARNRVHSKDVYEVMRPKERAEVDACIAGWARHITPLAEAWWKERGYGVVWPDDNAQPMQLTKLETD